MLPLLRIFFQDFLLCDIFWLAYVPFKRQCRIYTTWAISCDAQFELEIVIFGLTRRNWIVLHGQAKENLKLSLSSEILSQKVKKMQKFDKNPLF